MIKVNYDSNGNIIGFYPDDIQYSSIPEPYIEIDRDTHMDCINNPSLRKVDTVNKVIMSYTPPAPTADQVKKQKIAALDAQYHPKFEQLKEAKAAAEMLDNPTDAIKAQYAALFKEYCDKKAVVKNG